mgnify:CR=1 FL=1
MNIELMKQLEDLKEIYENLCSKLEKQIIVKKDLYIQNVKKDFSDFFKEKGFQINTENDEFTTATYKSLVARLSHADPTTNYFGCLFAFDLDLKSLNDNEYSIMLDRGVRKWTSSTASTESLNESDDTKMQKEIDSVKSSIEEIQKLLDNLKSEIWKLFIKNGNSTRYTNDGYLSMNELLSSIIK